MGGRSQLLSGYFPCRLCLHLVRIRLFRPHSEARFRGHGPAFRQEELVQTRLNLLVAGIGGFRLEPTLRALYPPLLDVVGSEEADLRNVSGELIPLQPVPGHVVLRLPADIAQLVLGHVVWPFGREVVAAQTLELLIPQCSRVNRRRRHISWPQLPQFFLAYIGLALFQAALLLVG